MIVVTGGAGFIGSAIVWGLNRKGVDDILVVDVLESDEKWKNLANLRFADYLDRDDFIFNLVEGGLDDSVDGIMHMGSCSSTTESDTGYLMRNNYDYSRRLAQWCLEHEKRYVYASSAATYGDGGKGFSDDHKGIPDLRPLNMYGYSKQLMDLWALRTGAADTIAGIKYFNVYGPNEYHKDDMRSVVHKAFGKIMETGKMQLFRSHRPDFEDGKQLRDFVYVKDAVDMTLFLYDRPDVNGIFNVGTGEARSFHDLVAAVFTATGKEKDIEYIDMPESIRDKYQYFTQAEMDKLRAAGYDKGITSLEDGVGDYVKSYILKDDPYLG
jgi:ADP-L-glycero-D-manno-heptose 6-epimerase